jgi:hypothetical protein
LLYQEKLEKYLIASDSGTMREVSQKVFLALQLAEFIA